MAKLMIGSALLAFALVNGAEECKTKNGINCIFPFIYHGKVYRGCEASNPASAWCATSLYTGGGMKSFGYCDKASCKRELGLECGPGELPLHATRGCQSGNYTCTKGDGEKCCDGRPIETRMRCVPCDETKYRKPAASNYTTAGTCDYEVNGQHTYSNIGLCADRIGEIGYDTKCPEQNNDYPVGVREKALRYIALAFAASANVYHPLDNAVKNRHIVINPSSTRWCLKERKDPKTNHRSYRKFAHVCNYLDGPISDLEPFSVDGASFINLPQTISIAGIFQSTPFGSYDPYYDVYACVNSKTKNRSSEENDDWEHTDPPAILSDEGAMMRRYVSRSRNLVVIAFRGSDSPGDYFKFNFDNQGDPIETIFARGYYNGFGEYFEILRDQFEKWVNEAQNNNRDLVITGHSLGAAAAYIAALHISNLTDSHELLKAVITFGSPRVGNSEFVGLTQYSHPRWRLCEKTISFANDYDTIPDLPIPGYSIPCSDQLIDLKAHNQVQNLGALAKHDLFTGYARGLDNLITGLPPYFSETVRRGKNRLTGEEICTWQTSFFGTCRAHKECNGTDHPNFCFNGECQWLRRGDKCGEHKCAPGFVCDNIEHICKDDGRE